MIRIVLAFILLSVYSHGQPLLLPSIGLVTTPSDNDSICPEPLYLGSFFTSGLQQGDTAYDFKLYDVNGDSMQLSEALSHGKPVLLIAGSYTCPVYRGKTNVVNDLAVTYANQVETFIIYTLEAHPDSDTSVYFGYVNPTTQNIQEGILYAQPKTYGERKLMVDTMMAAMTIDVPVFIDGPCNNWWNTYGPAPNNAYLIDTNGVVFSKHGWFDRFPENIYCDIDSLLGTNSGNCNSHNGSSTYTFQYLTNDTVIGPDGVMISVDAQLANTGADDILIHAQRIENDLPPGWATSMCIDVCYSTTTDSIVFLLPGNSIQPVHVYFYSTAGSGDTGHVKLGFKNLDIPANNNFMHAFGITTLNTTAVNINNISSLKSFPNPVTGILNVLCDGHICKQLQLFDLLGNQLTEIKEADSIDLSGFQSGIYLLKVNGVITRLVYKN